MRTVTIQNKLDIVVDIRDGLGNKYEVENLDITIHHDEKYGDSICIELGDDLHSIMDNYFQDNNYDLSMALILQHEEDLTDFFNGTAAITKKDK